jgi:hypothetical protein
MSMADDERADAQGFSTKVTALGDGSYGCRVLHEGKVIQEGRAESKAAVGPVLKDLLRWVDKLGYDSDMAAASRDRNYCGGYWKNKKNA